MRPLVVGLSVLVASGCGGSMEEQSRLAVFAASSLTEVFDELASEFERTNPDVDVQLALAGSQILRFQIEQGATFDLFASADETHMDALLAGGHVRPPETFATTDLVIIVPARHPTTIESFPDVDRAERIVVGAQAVPIGRYTEAMLERAALDLGDDFVDRVRGRIVSREPNVRLVRAKVELGEADAAIVYRTDALASEGVRSVTIPAAYNVEARFPVAVATRAPNEDAARRFFDFLTSPSAREVLVRHGFEVGA